MTGEKYGQLTADRMLQFSKSSVLKGFQIKLTIENKYTHTPDYFENQLKF